ncbi:hypothetical protein GCM10010172_80570 [Paractinoplanes ferrugineus]|uniref:Uncharacterized protein n=1 Tax=Paractinoplanes ferrugineus TaxID=113564 RepID=A0A919IZX7_9ACTN|nr:hypothetical protein [Actinoplanes ferrugineus]GIE10378.1 hypothetical protein Afe05nite_22180 [Actinoplanes ferrugineus]
MSRLAHWCLDRAARRWPADIRAEMAREWHAELSEIETRPGGGRRALAYALSLLTSPPLRDSSGAPRGWAETTGSPAPIGALIVAGLLTLGVSQFVALLVALAWPDNYAWPWFAAAVTAAPTAGWCLFAGRWLGRRMPLEPGARFGPATSAAVAPLLMTPALLLPAVTEQDLTYVLALLIGLLVWIPGIALLGVAAVRGRRLFLLGTPLVAALAAAAATLPMALTSDAGLRAAVASLTTGNPPPEFSVIPPGALSSRAFYHLGPWAITLTVFAVLALAFGTAALRPLPERALRPVATGDEPRPRPAVLIAAGATGLALAVIAWACTVAILGPAMPGVSASAPMPGGDGEIYLWVAELRWTSILLAALALLVAVADRRRAVPAALVLAGVLIGADGVLVRLGVHGAGGLRLALLVGGATVALGWTVARGPLAAGSERTVRRRIAVAAVLAAVCVPLLLSQGTPGVNHPYLPSGLRPTTVGLAVLGVLLAAVAAVAVRRHRLPGWVTALVIAVPAALVLAAGLLPVPADSEDSGSAVAGAFVGIPLAVVLVALLRRHRARPRGRTAALWVLLALAGLPGTVVLWLAGAFPGHIAPDLLFAVEGLGYPADGISLVPGAALLVTPIAALVAMRLDGDPARSRPAPARSPGFEGVGLPDQA